MFLAIFFAIFAFFYGSVVRPWSCHSLIKETGFLLHLFSNTLLNFSWLLSDLSFWAWFRRKYPEPQTNFIDIIRNPFISCLLNIYMPHKYFCYAHTNISENAEFQKKGKLSLSIPKTKMRCIFIEIVLWPGCFPIKFSCAFLFHCICHRLALLCTDSSSQLTFEKGFKDILVQL